MLKKAWLKWRAPIVLLKKALDDVGNLSHWLEEQKGTVRDERQIIDFFAMEIQTEKYCVD